MYERLQKITEEIHGIRNGQSALALRSIADVHLMLKDYGACLLACSLFRSLARLLACLLPGAQPLPSLGPLVRAGNFQRGSPDMHPCNLGMLQQTKRSTSPELICKMEDRPARHGMWLLEYPWKQGFP